MQKTAAKSSRWRNLPLLCECAKAVALCNNPSARHCTHSNTHKNEQEMFGLVALFAPVQAMRSLQNVKKSAGQALLQKFGVTGTHVNDQFLDKQLHKLFHDIDADGGGDIDLEEMKDGLENLGVFITDNELRNLMHEFDDDGSLTPEKFTKMCKSFLLHCAVVITKHDCSASLRGRRSKCRIPADLVIDGDSDGDCVQSSSEAKGTRSPAVRSTKSISGKALRGSASLSSRRRYCADVRFRAS